MARQSRVSRVPLARTTACGLGTRGGASSSLRATLYDLSTTKARRCGKKRSIALSFLLRVKTIKLPRQAPDRHTRKVVSKERYVSSQGTTDANPNAFGICAVLWDDGFKREQCHVSKLELLDLEATHAEMTRCLSADAVAPAGGGEAGGGGGGGMPGLGLGTSDASHTSGEVSFVSFKTACQAKPERTEEWYCAVLSSAHLLEVRIKAIWNWASVVGRDALGQEELTRLALKVPPPSIQH